jgi:hypothetical protein
LTTRDEDILDFDFFGDEEPPEWEDPEERRPSPPRDRGPRPRRRPRFRGPGNLTPLLRLIGLIALAILVVVLLAVWVDGCASDRKTERYRTYMTDIGAIGNASARLGQDLTTYLTTPALKLEDLDAKLGGYVQTAETHLQRAEDLGSPGPLHDSHEGAVESLQFRVNGIRGLRTAFQQTADAQEASAAGEQLSVQAARLVASDVIWADSFKASAEAVLESEGVEVEVPSSEFITADELTTPAAFAQIWTRIQGAASDGTPTGVHGNGISYVKALPSGQLLSSDTEATLKVSSDLAFEVGVEDSGDSQELRVVVTLTIPATPDPIVRRQTIPIIDPGETVPLTFNIGALVPFGEQVVKVDVDPVEGETNTANNTFEYPVVFTL